MCYKKLNTKIKKWKKKEKGLGPTRPCLCWWLGPGFETLLQCNLKKRKKKKTQKNAQGKGPMDIKSLVHSLFANDPQGNQIVVYTQFTNTLIYNADIGTGYIIDSLTHV